MLALCYLPPCFAFECFIPLDFYFSLHSHFFSKRAGGAYLSSPAFRIIRRGEISRTFSFLSEDTERGRRYAFWDAEHTSKVPVLWKGIGALFEGVDGFGVGELGIGVSCLIFCYAMRGVWVLSPFYFFASYGEGSVW